MDWLFDTSQFITRDRCGPGWTDSLAAVDQIANFLIFLSYISIGLTLLVPWYYIRWRLREHWVFLLFATFIVICGFSHLCHVLVFAWAPYRFFTLVDSLTAIASVPTAILLQGVVKRGLEGVDDETPAPGG